MPLSSTIKYINPLKNNYLIYDNKGKLIERRDGYTYKVSPYYLVNNFGKYYFMGYRYKYDSVSSYRIDYMKDVYIMEDRDRIDPKTLKEFKKYNSISDYINDHIYMFIEEVIFVKMILKGSYVVQYIHDWFGKNARIYKDNDHLMAEVKCDKLAFYYWAMQYY